jgi:hypothetical protein
MNEAPKWERGDTIRSAYGVLQLGKQAVLAVMDKIDTKLANAVNRPEDEQ